MTAILKTAYASTCLSDIRPPVILSFPSIPRATHILANNDNSPVPTARARYVGATVAQADISKAMDFVDFVVERRNSIPILSCIRAREVGGELELIATDLDLELSIRIPGDIETGLDTTLPAKELKTFLKSIKSAGTVKLSPVADKGRCQIDFPKVSYTVQTLEAADFPMMVAPEPISSFTLAGADLYDAISATSGAMSSEETRYYLNGIFVHAMADELRFVATDGHRLYARDLNLPEGASTMPGSGGFDYQRGVIIPRKSAKLIERMMKKGTPESVEITTDGSRIAFEFDRVSIKSKLIDGAFPDYQRIIPRHNQYQALVRTTEMADAVKAVSLISSERGRAIKLEVSPEAIRLTVNNPDSGSAVATIDAIYDGDATAIGFNANYMTEIIGLVGTDMTLHMQDASSPTVITGTRDRWMAVLMPMRI